MSSKKKILKSLTEATRPYLAKMLGSERVLKPDWRLDTSPRPAVRKFIVPDTVESSIRWAERGVEVCKKTENLRRPYRILSLDGGGVRGALTMTILNRIIAHDPNFLDEVDLICGTSAGGLLALMLSAGYSPKEVTELYHWSVPYIFGYDPWRVVNPFVARYSDKAKEELMKLYFGERTMMDLERTCAVVAFRLDGKKSHTHSFFNTDGWRPAVFTNMPRASGLVEPDFGLKVYHARCVCV